MNIIKDWFKRALGNQQVVVLILLLVAGFVVIALLGSKLLPVLASLGIAGHRDTLVASEDQAVRAAADLQQTVALKVQSPHISHRSAAGAVALNLEGEAEIRTAYRAILENAGRKHPDADIHGVLVSPMSGSGVEIIVGTTRDPDFGPILVLGGRVARRRLSQHSHQTLYRPSRRGR